MKSTITEREQKQQTLSARLSGETSTDTWYVLDCIYLRFGYICDVKQTCDGHVKQKLLSLPLLHETSSMRDDYHGLKMTVLPNWKSYSRKKTLIDTKLWEIYFNCIPQYILV